MVAARSAAVVPAAVTDPAPPLDPPADAGSRFPAEAPAARDAAATERSALERSARTAVVVPAGETAAGGPRTVAVLCAGRPPETARDSVAAAAVRWARRAVVQIASATATPLMPAPVDTVSGRSEAREVVVDSAENSAVGSAGVTEGAVAVAA